MKNTTKRIIIIGMIVAAVLIVSLLVYYLIIPPLFLQTPFQQIKQSKLQFTPHMDTTILKQLRYPNLKNF